MATIREKTFQHFHHAIDVWEKLYQKIVEDRGASEQALTHAMYESRNTALEAFVDQLLKREALETMKFRVKAKFSTFTAGLESGKFLYVSDSITADNFASPSSDISIDKEFELLPLDHKKHFTLENIRAKSHVEHYRHASLTDLLGFAYRYPHITELLPIAALGSRSFNTNSGFEVVTMESYLHGRKLDIQFMETEWSKNYRFLVYRSNNS